MTKQGGIKDIATGRSDVYRLPLDQIHTKPGWNVRSTDDPTNAEHVQMLAASIAQIGVRTPLRVYWEDGKAFVSDGHCRLAAARLAVAEHGADLKDVPVMTEARGANEADHVMTMLVGNSGKPLTPIETARVLKRLTDFGWTPAEIAAKIGRTPSYVSQLIDLNAAPQPVLDMVNRSLVSASLANAVMHKEGGTKAVETLSQAVERAKSNGKKKATARDVGETATGKTFKTEVREILARGRPDPKTVSWFFSQEDFTRLQELIG